MAKRLWHFRECAFGQAGVDGWTKQYRASSRAIDMVPMDSAPSADVSATGLDHFRPYGYVTASGAWSASDVLAYTPPVTSPNDKQQALAFFEVSSASPNWVGVAVRISGSAGSEDFYAAWLRGGSELQLWKFTAGVPAILDLAVNRTVGATTEGWFIRLEASGTTISCKAWRWDQPEPDAWDLSVVDAAHASGLPGLVAYLADSTSGEILNRPRFLSIDESATATLDAPMPKTRAEVVALSEGAGAQPVFLVELGVLGKTAAGAALESKVCVSNVPFVSSSVDDPASTAYDDMVLELPTFKAQASEIFSGKSTQSYGDLVIASEAGVRDEWLSYAWDGRAAEIWVGGVGWRRWDFIKVLTATIAEVNSVDERLVFKLRDKSAKTARRFMDDVLSGGIPDAGHPYPWGYGYIFNCEPIYSGSSLLYVYNDVQGAPSQQTFSEVRDEGVAVAASVTLLNISFQLPSAPAGRITFDADFGTDGVDHGDLFSAAAVRGGLAASEIYAGAGVGAVASLPDTSPAGIYVRDETTLGAVLDDIAASASLFWWFDRLGYIRCARFAAPEATPHHIIEEDDVDAGSFRLERLIPPSDPEFLYARKNYTVQKDGLAGAVTEDDRATYGALGELGVFTPSYSGLDQPDNHPLKLTPKARVTLYRDLADAVAEGERLDAIRRKAGGVFSIVVRAYVPTFGLGETIELTHTRMGFADGKRALIVGLEEDFGKGRVRITFFASIDGNFPTATADYPVVGEDYFY